MFEKAKRWWNKKKSISFTVYSFLFVITFIGGSFASLDEANASSLTPTIHSVSTFGNWSDPSSWIEGRIPTSDDVVEIDGDISLYGGTTVAGIFVAGNGKINIPYGTLVVNGDLINRGSYSVFETEMHGSSVTIDSTTPLTGNLTLSADISVIGDLEVTGDFHPSIQNISIEDNHGLIIRGNIWTPSSIGDTHGAFSGNNIFMETYGNIDRWKMTGSLGKIILHGNGNYFYLFDMMVKNVIFASGSSMYAHNSPGASSLHAERITIESGASLELENTVNIDGDIVNNGKIVGGGAIILGKNFFNNGVLDCDTDISLAGNLFNSGSWKTRSVTLNGNSGSVLEFHYPLTGNLTLNTDISIIGNLEIYGDFHPDIRNISIEDNHGLIVHGNIWTPSSVGDTHGYFSGNNIFVEAYGDIDRWKMTGSLEKLIFHGTDNYFYLLDVEVKDVIVTPGASMYAHHSPGVSLLHANTFTIATGGTLTLGNSVTIDGDLVNNGYILGGGSLILKKNFFNNGAINGSTSVLSSGNIFSLGPWTTLDVTVNSSSGNILQFQRPLAGNLILNADISTIGNLEVNGNFFPGIHNISIEDNHGIIIHGNIWTPSSIGDTHGHFSGNNIFFETYGDIDRWKMTGSLEKFTLHGVGNYLYLLDMTAKNVTFASDSSPYFHQSPGASSLHTERLTIETGASLELRNTVNIDGDVVNNGDIIGGTINLAGSIENQGRWTSTTNIFWNSYPGATNYNLIFTSGTSTGITTTGLSYNITDKVNGQYYWQVTPDNGTTYPERCINMGCVSGWTPPPANTIPAPTNLTQQIQSLGQGIQSIQLGEKIGKYQSGSGVILSSSGDMSISSKLVVDVYRIGDTSPQEFSGGYSTDGNKTITLPYLGAGSYRWKARVETAAGDVSDWVDFGTDNPEETDYALYEGFEPYPYGYSFVNSGPANGILSGGIGETFWTGERYKIDGNKWEIFNMVFPPSVFGDDLRKQMDGFESIGLNNENPRIFFGGNCFGLAFSALLGHYRSQVLKSYFPDFYNLIGDSGTIWENVSTPIIGSGSRWNNYNTVFKTILSYQLYQKMNGYIELKEQSKRNQTPNDILNYLKNNPNNPYLLTISGRTCYFDNICPVQYHAVVPYKVEGNKIYIWDNNVPFSKENSELAYNQFIEINQYDTWSSPYYGGSNFGWDYFGELSLVNINDMYSSGENQNPIGFNGSDFVISLSGDSDVYFEDSQGRISGFSGGVILEQIPGVIVVEDFNVSGNGYTGENTWKQIYLPQKQDGLTIKVSGKTGESYDLMVAGGDYYTKVTGVTTSTGQLDSYQVTGTSVTIDFDNNKTGTYALLVDNFQDTLTGTVYLDNIKTSTGTEQYIISWTGVVAGTSSAVQYSVDSNSDGIDDLTLGLPAVYQDVTAPTTTHTLSGELVAGTTTTYIESLALSLTSVDDSSGVGVDTIYYALGTDTGSLIYLPYTEPVVVNGVGTYTLHYYAVDKFGNQEGDKTTVFTLIERPETYAGNISGYVYDDTNQNGVRDLGEAGMAGWKVCIDTNNNGTCEENSEPFNLSNNDGYYEFDSLITGTYSILEIPHQNWIVTQPTTTAATAKRIINLSNGQRLQNQNFGNFKTKGSKK